jgi:hypothetical protein
MHRLKNGSLLDVQLQISSGISPLQSGFPDSFYVNSALPQSFFQTNSIAIRALAICLDSMGPSKRRRAEEAPAKTRTLLIGPINQANGNRRLAVKILHKTAQHLEAGEKPQASVQPTAIRNGVKMAPKNKRAI